MVKVVVLDFSLTCTFLTVMIINIHHSEKTIERCNDYLNCIFV